jgi:hypothetical protein
MNPSIFTHTTLGSTGFPVCRLGLSATYRPGKEAIYYALDQGINYFFGFGVDTQMSRTMREVIKSGRDRVVIATGVYNLIWGYPDIRKTLEKRLRQWGTDTIDLFMFLGIRKASEFPLQCRTPGCRAGYFPSCKHSSPGNYQLYCHPLALSAAPAEVLAEECTDSGCRSLLPVCTFQSPCPCVHDGSQQYETAEGKFTGAGPGPSPGRGDVLYETVRGCRSSAEKMVYVEL